MFRKSLISGLCISLIAVIVAAAENTRVADAAMKGDRATVRSLLKQEEDVNAAQGDGMTAVHWAALNGDVELAQMLLYAGANPQATTRLGSYTPLFMASKSGHASVIDVLLKAGAEIHCRDWFDSSNDGRLIRERRGGEAACRVWF